MPNKALKKFYSTNSDIVNIQENVGNAVDPLIKNQFLNGQLINDIALVIGDNDISHKLGRKIQGWVIVDIDAVSNIYRKTSTTPTLTIKLNSSANCTVSLYIF